MTITINRHVSLTYDGKVEWKVKGAYITEIEGVEFVKLPASDPALCKMVCSGIVDRMPKGCSLSQSSGIKELLRLRNEKQSSDLVPASSAANLFAAMPDRKRSRRSVAAIREMRDSLALCDVAVPGFRDSAGRDIKMVRPVHPRDDICVQLDKDVLEFIVGFIRFHGLDEATVANRRQYATAGSRGIWRQGDGLVVRVGDDGGVGHKFRRVKTLDEAEQVVTDRQATSAGMPIADGDADSEIGVGEPGTDDHGVVD